MLYPFQKTGVEFLTSRKTALLADDMGLGKTIQLIEAATQVNAKKILVVCPASVKLHWARKFQDWANIPSKDIQVLCGQEADISDKPITIVNYDILRFPWNISKLRSYSYDVLICDESHYVKNIDTQRAKMVLGKQGLVLNANRVWLSTGTPVLNKPVEIYAILRVLYPDSISDTSTFEAFAEYYCEGYRDKWGFHADGASHIDELAENIKPFYIRRMKEDVIPDLPDTVETLIPLEITPPIKKVIDMISEHDINKIDVSDWSKMAALGWLATQRRELAEAKVAQCVDFINDQILINKDKVVIFAYHKHVITALKNHFSGVGVSCITGSTSSNDRQKELDNFIEGKNTVFLGQLIAAGQGLDGLQKVCDTVVFVEYDWVPGVNDQARDRLRRIGQKNTVFSYTLYIPNTLEEKIIEANNRKRAVINSLILTTQETQNMTIEERLQSLEEAIRENTAALLASGTEPAAKPNSRSKPTSKPAAKPAAEAKEEVKPSTAEIVVNHDEVNQFVLSIIKSSANETEKAANSAAVKAVIAKYGKKIAEVPADKLNLLYADLQTLVEKESEAETEF